jgi:hypothetical protein
VLGTPLVHRALLALGVLACAGCRPAHRTLEDLPPEVTLYGVRMTYFRGDEISATGQAAELTFERHSSDFVSSDASMRFPDKDGKGETRLWAPVVRGNLSARQADGSGGVSMRSSDGLQGHTPTAHLDGMTMVATGHEPVHLSRGGSQVDAQNFVFRFRDGAYDFGDGVTSVLEGKK